MRIYRAAGGVPGSVVCLGTALAWHHLADAVPRRVQLAVPRGSEPRRRLSISFQVIEYDPETFTVGVSHAEPLRGADTLVTGVERTLVDAIVRRDHVREAVAREAVRRYRTRSRKWTSADRAMLFQVARMVGVEERVTEFFESTI
ncbi:hypothetical protein GCM10022247_51000 [Allokutzneria multivorans]|uniref:Uncharacterized protein n=2 Tax=Allokutzneria multivorans TaxID=1142134 RepID=A0ABP7T440_9PSEU